MAAVAPDSMAQIDRAPVVASHDQQEEYVILIHGTFSYAEGDEGPGWFQRNSDAALRLARSLGPRYRINPRRIVVGGQAEAVPEAVFHWSGQNSERMRRLAAEKLLECLRWYESRSLGYHLVAHSHGGSVVWESLQLAAQGGAPADGAAAAPLPHLKSWTTVGTPFFHCVPSSAGLRGLVLLVLTLLVLARQSGWFWDYWGSVPELSGTTPFGAFVGLTWAYAFLCLAPTLVLLAAYRCFKVVAVQRSESRYPDARLLEFWRLVQSLVLTAVTLTALGLPLFRPGLLGWLWPGFESLAPAVWTLARTRPALILPVAYGWAAIALVVACSASVLFLIGRSIECERRVRTARRAWGFFHDRYRYLAYLGADEAINGLRKSQYGIDGPLLPRIRRPGDRTYGMAGRTLVPEAFARETRLGAGLFGMLVVLPILQIYDWILRPLYNEVFAVLVDEFVLGRFTAQAHGADLPGLRLGFVSTTPFPLEAECPQGFRRSGYLRDWFLRRFTLAGLLPDEAIERQIRARFVGPSLGECDDLLRATHRRAGDMVEALRSMLGVPSMAAVSLIAFLSQALKEGGQWSDLLIHTTYFKNKDVLNRIADAIDPRGRMASARPGAASGRGPGRGAVGFAWPPSGFGWWIVRGMVRALILATPALALYVAGREILYPESREFQIRWASTPSLGLTTLVRDAENPQDSGLACGTIYAGVPSVRWYASVRVLDLDEASSILASADEAAGRKAYRFADIEASAAKKLAALGRADAATSLLKDASGRVKREQLLAKPDEANDLSRIDDAIADAAGGEPSPPRIGGATKRDVEAAAKAVCEALCLLPESPDRPGDVEYGRAPRRNEVVKALECLAGLCASYDRLDRESQRLVLGSIADVVDTVSRSRWFSLSISSILGTLVTIDQSLQEQDCFKDAEEVIAGAGRILAAVPGMKLASADVVADYSVLLAKAHRWPETRVDKAQAFLEQALRFVDQDPQSGLQKRVDLRARIACGYARLGRFHQARGLSEAALVECRLNVATEMLLNEYERKIVQGQGSQVDAAKALARCGEVFD